MINKKRYKRQKDNKVKKPIRVGINKFQILFVSKYLQADSQFCTHCLNQTEYPDNNNIHHHLLLLQPMLISNLMNDYAKNITGYINLSFFIVSFKGNQCSMQRLNIFHYHMTNICMLLTMLHIHIHDLYFIKYKKNIEKLLS